MAITPNEAVKKAYEYLKDVSSADFTNYANFRVEEAKNEGGFYYITLSYEYSSNEFPFVRTRNYKDFKLDSDGNVVSMTIRKI
jgi:hypothetical protein